MNADTLAKYAEIAAKAQAKQNGKVEQAKQAGGTPPPPTPETHSEVVEQTFLPESDPELDKLRSLRNAKYISDFEKAKAKQVVVVEKEDYTEILEDPIELVEYSANSFALFGEATRAHSTQLRTMGSFNKWLKYEDGRKAGWIFSNKRRKQVEEFLESVQAVVVLV